MLMNKTKIKMEMNEKKNVKQVEKNMNITVEQTNGKKRTPNYKHIFKRKDMVSCLKVLIQASGMICLVHVPAAACAP